MRRTACSAGAPDVVEGGLHNVPLSDVFQIIATGQKSGVLSVTGGEVRARIYLERGRVQLAHMSPGVLLGEILVQLDLLTAREVQEFLARQERENAGTPLGLMAVAAGLLSEEDLYRALRRQAVEVIAELLTWRQGDFSFKERSMAESQVPTERTYEAMGLLMEADTLRRELEGGMADPAAIYRRSGDPTLVTLPDGAWDVLSHVDGLRSARTVASDSDLGEGRVLGILKRLEEVGVLAPLALEGPEPTVLVVSASSAMQRLVRLTVQRVGLRPLLFVTGDDALAVLDEVRPSVVVVDDRGGEGWDTVRALRRIPGRGHLPAVVLTDADEEAGWLTRLRRPRAQVLTRPFDELQLQTVVSRLAGRPLA